MSTLANTKPVGSGGVKRRRGGSAAKYDTEKRTQQTDPRRTKLHVNAPQNLRGYAGVMCTYEGNEGAATVELHRLFGQYLEVVYPKEEQDEDPEVEAPSEAAPGVPLTASDLLKRELASLNDDDDRGAAAAASKATNAPSASTGSLHSAKLMTVRTNCKGVVMLRVGAPVRRAAPPVGAFPSADEGSADSRGLVGASAAPEEDDEEEEAAPAMPAVDPVAVYRALFEAVAASGEACSRHVVRCVPLQLTCFAGPDEVAEALGPLLEAHFGKGQPPRTLMVALKRRNNYSLDKDALISRLVDLVLALNPRHTVALKGAQVAVVVEVNQALAGVSVVGGGDWDRFHEFNLKKFQTQHTTETRSYADGQAGT